MATRGFENWTEADVQKRDRQHVKERRTKYGAKPTAVDGRRFDSEKEARRWSELKMLEQAGSIVRLKPQQHFELVTLRTNLRGDVQQPMERVWVVGEYVADFTYDELTPEATTFVVEDVKGFKTKEYLWKRRHFEAQYGITIREI